MKRHALFAGVNAYDDKAIRSLRYSVSDASVLADRFKGLGYATRLLADPSGAELKAAVAESVEGLGHGDVFLFFFAGHGFTAQDGAHLLFCRDDRKRLLRVNSAGVRVDALEALTDEGGFHRAFLLDSCRTDCFAGMEGRGAGTERDLDFVGIPKCAETSGSFFLLRSCDKFRPSLEFDAIGHGLFTQGLLDAMDARDGRLASCDSSFATAVRDKMESIQRGYSVEVPQRPSIGECSGPAFSLFDNGFLAPVAQGAVPLFHLVACPVCGRKNDPKDTFKCRACGRDNLCLRHQDEGMFLCAECVEERKRKSKEKRKFHDLPAMPANARTDSIVLDIDGCTIHFFSKRIVTFGRKREFNDFVIRPPATFNEAQIAPYRRISRQHCFFEPSGANVLISDGGRSSSGDLRRSSAGTFWNGRNIGESVEVPAGTSGVMSFGGSACGDWLKMNLKACDSRNACAACPLADEDWRGDGSRPCLMLSRTDGVAEKFVGLWSCFELGDAVPSCRGYVVFRKNGAFAYCHDDGQTGWFVPGTKVQTKFGELVVK